MSVPADFKELLPKQASPGPEDDRPLYYLWVFDPHTNKVILDHNEDKHPAHHVLHRDVGKDVLHSEKVQGYAYAIDGGWRITNDDHGEVTDPFIVNQVVRKLRGEHPEPALPSIRYHG